MHELHFSMSLPGCVSLIFSPWHAAPSFLCVISPSQIRLPCLCLCSVGYDESLSSVADPVWGCKHPPQLISRLRRRAAASISLFCQIKLELQARDGRTAAECAAFQNKVRCICMRLNSTEYIFSRVRMSWPVMYCCVAPVCMRVGVWARSPACALLCIGLQPPRTVHVLTVIDETTQKQRKG